MENLMEVSKWLIENGTGMSVPSKKGNLKLQKLLYYAQAMNLVINNEKLFANDVQAWSEGPVIKDAYIAYRYENLWSFSEIEPLSVTSTKILKIVLDLFNDFSSEELVNMTHDETPWKQYENLVGPYKNIIIDDHEIKDYYQDYFTELYESYQNEERMVIGNNCFVFDKEETELTEEDIEVLKNTFDEHVEETFFVYKEDGELVAY